MKTFRFEGTVTAKMILWIDGETLEEAEQKFVDGNASDLSKVTSIQHIVPDMETLYIENKRESTSGNP